MKPTHLLLISTLIATLCACGDDSGAAFPQTLSDPSDLVSCDITEAECQRAIFASVATFLEADPFNTPPIRTISVQQLEEELRGSLTDDDLAGDDPATRGLRLMGFIPDQAMSLTETQTDYAVNYIAAYYSRGSITVIDRDYGEVDAQLLLAHEFVHAIQDRQFGIGNVYGSTSTEDGFMGARSVIEGDATHSSFAWVYEQLEYSNDEIDWSALHDERKMRSRESAADPSVPLIDSASGFPYTYGFALMTNASLDQGLAGRASFFEDPPTSALAVVRGYEEILNGRAPLVDEPAAAHPSPVSGHEVGYDDRVGAWYVFGTLMRLGMAEEDAWARADTWVGDQFGVFESGSEVVAVWRIRLDGDPSFMVDAVNQSDRSVAWWAAAEGSDVFIIAADSEAGLAQWEAQPLDVVAAMVEAAPDARKGVVDDTTCRPPPFRRPPLKHR